MEKWRSITTAANRAFELNCDSEAHGHYIAARDRAEILVPHWFDTEEATVALAISYQNLADLYLRQGKQNDALETYQILIKRLQAFRDQNPDKHGAIDRVARRTGADLLLIIKNLNIESQESDQLIHEINMLRTNNHDQLNEENY